MNGTISNIASFPKLRNGAAADAVPAARSSSLPVEFSFPNIAGLNQDRAASHVGAFVALEFSKHAVAKYGADIDGVLPADGTGNLADWEPYIVLATGDGKLRTTALVIGSCRATYAAAWNIRHNETAASERDNANLATYDPQTRRVGLTSGHSDAARNLTLAEAMMLSFEAMDEEEQAFGFAIMTMALGALPACGVQLLVNGHHYLSSETKFTKAIENQVLAMSTASVRAMWMAAAAEIRDLLWHKSCHAISANICKRLALDPETKVNLDAARLGSATVRLPFEEDPLRRAEAYAAVVNAVQITMAQMSSSVSVPVLEAELAAAKAAPHPVAIGGALWVGVPLHPDAVSREDLIVRYLIPSIERAKTAVAFAAGVYKGVLESSDDARDSRMTAHSIRKLIKDEVGAYGVGQALYRSHSRFTRAAAERGQFCPIDVSDQVPGGMLMVAAPNVAAAAAAAGPVVAAPAIGAAAPAAAAGGNP
jgi:hypothetical protein